MNHVIYGFFHFGKHRPFCGCSFRLDDALFYAKIEADGCSSMTLARWTANVSWPSGAIISAPSRAG